MKNILLAIGLFLGFIAHSNASTYSCCEVLLTGGTNFVAPSTVNTMANTVDASKQDNIPFEITFKSQGTNTLKNLNPSVALTNVALRYAIKRTGE